MLMTSTVAIASDTQTDDEKYSTISDLIYEDTKKSSENLPNQESIHADITAMLSKKSCGLILKNFLCNLTQFNQEDP
jgi:hypothetical protein